MTARLLVSLVLLSACGGGQANVPIAAAPLTAAEEILFENGVDFVADPSVLEGRWRSDWSSELDGRVRNSDLILIVRIPTLRTDTDLEGQVTYRLVVEELDAVIGHAPPELQLLTGDGDGGFVSVHTNQERVQDQTFVLFAKWAPGEHGGTIARWHLAPATDGVRARVEFLAERRRGVTREETPGRVIVHEN